MPRRHRFHRYCTRGGETGSCEVRGQPHTKAWCPKCKSPAVLATKHPKKVPCAIEIQALDSSTSTVCPAVAGSLGALFQKCVAAGHLLPGCLEASELPSAHCLPSSLLVSPTRDISAPVPTAAPKPSWCSVSCTLFLLFLSLNVSCLDLGLCPLPLTGYHGEEPVSFSFPSGI